MNIGLYLITLFFVVTSPIFILLVDMSLDDLFLYTKIMLVNITSMVSFGELMYASHVEKMQRPNVYIIFAMTFFSAASGVPWLASLFARYVDEQSLQTGFFAFGSIGYYLGCRTQEKRLQSDVIARFEEVPREDVSDNDLI